MTGLHAASCMVAVAAAGCMPYRAMRGPIMEPPLSFQDSTGPLSYESPTPADVAGQGAEPAREVVGRACQRGVTLPLAWFRGLASGDFRDTLASTALGAAWGEGGYADALAEAQGQAPRGRLYDVRADLQILSILGVYREQCVVIHAAVGR